MELAIRAAWRLEESVVSSFTSLRRLVIGSALLSFLVLGIDATARAGVVVTAVGTPNFVPVDFNLFAAPIGTAATGYSEVVSISEHVKVIGRVARNISSHTWSCVPRTLKEIRHPS
jgi:hypothetical protein